MAHRIEFFTGDCPLCRSFLSEIELGKCGACHLEVIDVRRPEAAPHVRAAGIQVVPTALIDDEIRVEGRLDEPWLCGDEFYENLRRRFGTRSEPRRRPGRPSANVRGPQRSA